MLKNDNPPCPVKTDRPSDYDYQIYYRSWHTDSPEHARLMGQMLAAQLAPLVEGREHVPVLDVGCGMGFALLGLQQLGFTDIHGVERDAGQAESARGLGLDVVCVDDTVELLNRTPGKYSTILLLDVLEHIPVSQQILFLRAIHRALRDGGRLVMQVPNANSLFASVWRYGDYTHTSSFTTHSLRFCVLNAGFSSISFVTDLPLSRPSVRLWHARARASWGRWLLQKLWRSAFLYEFSAAGMVPNVQFGLNLLAYADK